MSWADFADDIETHGVGVLVYERLAQLEQLSGLPQELRAKWAANAQHAKLQCAIQRQDAGKISAAFEQAGIRHAFMKGLVAREEFYAPVWARPGADLDILVSPEDTERARKVMFDVGFIHASRTWDFRRFRPATVKEIVETESSHHELAQFAKTHRLVNLPDWLFGPDFARGKPFTFEQLDGGPVFHSVVDVHWALHFFFTREQPLRTVRRLTLANGGHVFALSLEWSLIFTCFKLYFESFERSKHGMFLVADLIGILARADELDWDTIIEVTERNDLTAAMFYTLCAIEQICGKPLVPAGILDAWQYPGEHDRADTRPLDSRREASSLDFGDFLPHLFGARFPSAFLAE